MQLEERKRKRRCEYDCKDHIFYIQTLKANCSKYDIRVQFCPKYQRDPLPPEQTYPEYNHDGKYFTSAFVLGVDKRILVKNEQQELMDHQKQIRDSLEKHNQLVFPRPNSKHSLCSVCKEHYRNYYFHISSEEHRERISLSSYNTHILKLCNLYRHLWEGCEEKADEEAERLAIEEEDRRQRMAEAEPEEQYTNSLLDCQRGDQDRYDENGDPLSRSRNLARRPSSRSFMHNDDTMTIGRSHKRANPEARSAYEPSLRKHSYHGHFNPAHAARERKERNYERERMKLTRGTEFQRYKKDFVALPNEEGDVFTILVPAQPGQAGIVEAPVKAQSTEKPRKMQEEAGHPRKSNPQKRREEQIDNEVSSVSCDLSQSESGSSSSSSVQEGDPNINLIKNKGDSVEEGELSKSSSSGSEEDVNITRKIEHTDKQYRYQKNTEIIQNQWKMDPRNSQPYPYGYQLPLPRGSQENPKYDQAYKGPTPNKTMQSEYYKYPEHSKGVPPPYYYPYPYPLYDPQFGSAHPSDKGASIEKDKKKNSDKNPYQYPMHYPWGYPPHYYMPPPHNQHGQPEHPPSQPTTERPPTQNKIPGNNPNSPYVGSTSININFPMYMCPPPHPSMQNSHYSMPPSRYPASHQPYMGYQYGPYQDRNRGEGEYQSGGQGQAGGPQGQCFSQGSYGKGGGYYGGSREGQQPSKYPQAPPYYYPPYMGYHNPQGPYNQRQKSPKRDA